MSDDPNNVVAVVATVQRPNPPDMLASQEVIVQQTQLETVERNQGTQEALERIAAGQFKGHE